MAVKMGCLVEEYHTPRCGDLKTVAGRWEEESDCSESAKKAVPLLLHGSGRELDRKRLQSA